MIEKYVDFMFFLYSLKAVYFRLFLLGNNSFWSPKSIIQRLPQFNDYGDKAIYFH